MDAFCPKSIIAGNLPIIEKFYPVMLERILQQIDCFALIVSENGFILKSFGPCEKMTGYQETEVINKRFPEFIFGGKKVEWESLIRFSGGDEQPLMLTLKRKDGSVFLGEIQILRLEQRENRPKLFGLLIKERYVKKAVQNDPIITLERLKQLAAEVAHEIRNPLTSLQGFIQLLRANPARFSEYLQIIDDEIQQIELITAELMLLAKPQEFHFTRSDLRAIVEHCINVMAGEAFQRGVEFVQEFTPEKISIVCDGQKIKQVLINLFKNALEAMEKPGEVTVKVRQTEQFVYIMITDQGVGIPEGLIPRITEPFFTTKSNGSGLGLMICRKIIEGHEGFMKISSKEHQGTTFKIGLPTHLTESVAKKRKLF